MVNLLSFFVENWYTIYVLNMCVCVYNGNIRKLRNGGFLMKMKYVLENPSFTTGPVEIDNPKAVKQIAAYVNKPIILGEFKYISC